MTHNLDFSIRVVSDAFEGKVRPSAWDYNHDLL